MNIKDFHKELEQEADRFDKRVDQLLSENQLTSFEAGLLKTCDRIHRSIGALRADLHDLLTPPPAPAPAPVTPAMTTANLKKFLDLMDNVHMSHSISCPALQRGNCLCGFNDLLQARELYREVAR